MKHFFKEHLFPVIMIIVGAACAAFSIECFLIPNTILDGGVTGVSMMINYLTRIRLSILVIVINIPFFFVGYKALGKCFLLRAVIAMAAFSGFLEVCKLIPTVTSSELLAVVFGGVLLGVGVGILFGWDRAMLSLLTYFITFKLIDIVQEGMEQAKAAMIITDHAADIADTIYQQLGRTCTFISAEGLVSGSTKTVLYCVITRVEVNQLKRIISEADVSAFVTISEVSEIIGNHVKSSSAAIDEKALNQ